MASGIILFISGIVLFLFGMIKLSNGIQRLFSVRFREYVKYSLKRPIYGLFIGLGATILFQSSSATSVLAIGIVSAGLISFYNSLSIILGSDIGTTITVWLVAWKITEISPVFIAGGGLLWLIGKERIKLIGEAFFYFGLIFFGLSMASHATSPLRDSAAFVNFFKETKNPLLGVFAGIIFTGIVQASAIPISILVIFGHQGLISIENAFPIVLGANIGTTITGFIAGSVANINGKRTAISHFIFKSTGVLIFLFILEFYIPLIKSLSPNTGEQIALGHLLFNLAIAIIFILILRPFSILMERLIPGEKDILSLWPEYLNDKFLQSPEEALISVRKELYREIVLAKRMLSESFESLSSFSEGKRRNIAYIELIVDNLQAEIANYLGKISCANLPPDLAQKLFLFTTMVDDIERIADHCLNLSDLARYKYRKKASFSKEAQGELVEIEDLVERNVDDAIALIQHGNEEKIKEIFSREDLIDIKVKRAMERHLERFYKGICLAEAGPIFVDVLINLERISDHCQNIAEYISKIDFTLLEDPK
jgi:phosphate:Na+ symporter